jgi:hypothetical protein
MLSQASRIPQGDLVLAGEAAREAVVAVDGGIGTMLPD